MAKQKMSLEDVRSILSTPSNFDYARDDMGKRVGSSKYIMLSTREADYILHYLPRPSRAKGK